MVKSILLVGVGGQGTILASNLLIKGLMEAGYDVKMSEIHGMSQRGGSVSSQVRYGKEVFSPVIEKGGADILVSFERMEALRWLNYLKEGGKTIVNNYRIDPMPVLNGKVDYPDGIIEELEEKASARVFNAGDIAEEIGNSKTMNVVLLGALVKSMGLDHINWERIIEENVKKNFIEVNKIAFRRGMEEGSKV